MNALRQAEIVCNGEHKLMLLGVKANGAIKGRLLAMNLQQRFRNASDSNVEIAYTFPLPWGAVLMGVDVKLNGKPLHGEVTAKSTARARYEEALSEGNSSIMLERNPDHSYTLELGNLMAREECDITVRYAQVLKLEHGQIRLMLPTTIAPRYGDPITQGGLQPHQTAVTDIAAKYPFDISISLHGDLAKANVASPSHATGYFPQGEELVVRLAQRGSLDRDFILTLANLASQSMALACPDACQLGQVAVMANFSPMQPGGRNDLPVSVKVLVDCSGSMGGDSIDAARNALHKIVSSFDKGDRFSLSRFGTTVEHRSRGMWGGTPQAKASAKRWVETVEADLGGTEMADALVSTIAIAHTGKSDILLITDGEIEGIDAVIKVANQSGHRVFVVAIGASPAEAHLRRLAEASGGVCDFVAPGEDVEPAVLRMFSRLRGSQADKLRVEWPASMTVRWAQRLPDSTFTNDTIQVMAFVESQGLTKENAVIRLWGKPAGEDAEVVLAQVSIEFVESTVNTLARVVAFGQYAQTDTKEGRQLPTAQTTGQALAVKYQLVTEETNFILVHTREDAEKAQEMPQLHKVPQMLAAGWSGTGKVAIGQSVSSVRYRTTSASVAASSSPTVFRGASISSACVSSSYDDMDDDIDAFQIPAFLRKQVADLDSYNFGRTNNSNDPGLSPAAFSKWLETKKPNEWPSTYAELRNIGLGIAICEWIEFEIGEGRPEAVVVQSFIAVVRDFKFATTSALQRTLQQSLGIGRPVPVRELSGPILEAIREGLLGTRSGSWPTAVLSFPQSLGA